MTSSRVVIPVTEHDVVTAHTLFTWRAAREDRAAARLGNLDFHMWMRTANCIDTFIEWIVRQGLCRNGRGFSHAATDRDFPQVHSFLNRLHQFHRTRSASHNAGA